MTRRIRQVLLASAVGLLAGVAAVLGLAAAADAWSGYGVAVLVGLASVWFGQAALALVRHLLASLTPTTVKEAS